MSESVNAGYVNADAATGAGGSQMYGGSIGTGVGVSAAGEQLHAGNIQEKRVCKQCLLRDFPMDAYFKEMNAQIDAMDPMYRVDDDVYEERLSQCRQCDKLEKGMCRVCGCYVEWRAAMRFKACPNVHPRWGTDMEM